MRQDIKVFIKYLLKQPYYNIKYILHSLKEGIFSISKIQTWFWACVILMAYSWYNGSDSTGLFMVVIIILYILILWKIGTWRYEEREKKGYSLHTAKKFKDQKKL